MFNHIGLLNVRNWRFKQTASLEYKQPWPWPRPWYKWVILEGKPKRTDISKWQLNK